MKDLTRTKLAEAYLALRQAEAALLLVHFTEPVPLVEGVVLGSITQAYSQLASLLYASRG